MGYNKYRIYKGLNTSATTYDGLSRRLEAPGD